MKVCCWDYIQDKIQGKNFDRSIFQGTPLAYFDKEVADIPNNFSPFVIYEYNNKLFIANSLGEVRLIPFSLISLLDSVPKK